MDIYDDPEHWLERADEIRATARYACDRETKRTLLLIGDEYERLARLAEARRAKLRTA
jgi:hypothetical protein